MSIIPFPGSYQYQYQYQTQSCMCRRNTFLLRVDLICVSWAEVQKGFDRRGSIRSVDVSRQSALDVELPTNLLPPEGEHVMAVWHCTFSSCVSTRKTKG